MTDDMERRLLRLIATDRISIPVKSMAGKLDRARPKLGIEFAGELNGSTTYSGERSFAKVSYEDEMKTRGMRDGIQTFTAEFPRYGAILNGMIEEQRATRESHLYFGMNPGSRLTTEDYVGVMEDLGFTSGEAEKLYPRLMDISRKLSKKRDETRSVLIG